MKFLKRSWFVIFEYIKAKLQSLGKEAEKSDSKENSYEKQAISPSAAENLEVIRKRFHNSVDFISREIIKNGIRVNFLMIEGMIDFGTMADSMLKPLQNEDFGEGASPDEIYDFIMKKTVMAGDIAEVFEYDEIFRFIMSGFVVILVDGVCSAAAFGLQGFQFRSISEPASEVNEKGSRESFTEPVRINMSMVRRRIKSPSLKFEFITLGEKSKTDVCLAYLTDKAPPELIEKIKERLSKVKLSLILTSEYLRPFLEDKPFSFFSAVGQTERPDVLCGKINEGRVALLIDGTPYALIVPFLFSENFQTLDDYAHPAFYASFMRLLKYFSFGLTVLLPSLYVAVGTFHPELFPPVLLSNIAKAEETTPFPLMFEALLIHFLYEIMREAGLRLPRAVGHAVSIVGALVIGDASVSAGLIGAPMVLVVAMTAISSFVVPQLYEPVAVLRFLFIIVGGTLGLFGIALGSILILVNVCSINELGTPYTAPISPFSFSAMRDTFIRVNFKQMQKKNANVNSLNGAHISKNEEARKWRKTK